MTRWIGLDTGSSHTALVALDAEPGHAVYVDHKTLDVGERVERVEPRVSKNGRVSTHERRVEPADIEAAADACLAWIREQGGEALALEYVAAAYVGDDPRASAKRATNLIRTSEIGALVARDAGRLLGMRVERVTAREARSFVAPGVKADSRGAALEPALAALIVGWQGRTFAPTDEERRRDHERDAAAAVIAVLLRDMRHAQGIEAQTRVRAREARPSPVAKPCGGCKRGHVRGPTHQRACALWARVAMVLGHAPLTGAAAAEARRARKGAAA